eukprot:CAMPEP_0115842194 /NCGR_PEP_ID=MMETSP0287-20121206/7675_1 /TAXON_ID=412157 /ORGANISM="Chrysochromulina rotalis, Strain UIO044" /LENGTH=261 /DNA_ID=CAMNT_0003295857 /DNA_START=271 /DNA_END=1054 /DNA_ORIENTATION=-
MSGDSRVHERLASSTAHATPLRPPRLHLHLQTCAACASTPCVPSSRDVASSCLCLFLFRRRRSPLEDAESSLSLVDPSLLSAPSPPATAASTSATGAATAADCACTAAAAAADDGCLFGAGADGAPKERTGPRFAVALEPLGSVDVSVAVCSSMAAIAASTHASRSASLRPSLVSHAHARRVARHAARRRFAVAGGSEGAAVEGLWATFRASNRAASSVRGAAIASRLSTSVSASGGCPPNPPGIRGAAASDVDAERVAGV